MKLSKNVFSVLEIPKKFFKIYQVPKSNLVNHGMLILGIIMPSLVTMQFPINLF